MSQALNGIAATMFHDEGAIAQCGHCKRYTLDRKALADSRQPVCDCGKQHYWSGSFKPPGPDAQWFGPAPQSHPKPETAENANAGAGLQSHAQPVAEPTDPMDWPLPCDVTVGHGTMRKGVKLRTLVARMKVLYEMATGENADAVAARTPAERSILLDQFLAAAAEAGVTHLSAQHAAQPVAQEPAKAFDAEGFRAWVAKNLPDDTIIGKSAWWADHLTAWAKRFAAPVAQPVPQALSDERILHIVDTQVGGATPSYPLDNSDWIIFARAVIAEFCRINGINGTGGA